MSAAYGHFPGRWELDPDTLIMSMGVRGAGRFT